MKNIFKNIALTTIMILPWSAIAQNNATNNLYKHNSDPKIEVDGFTVWIESDVFNVFRWKAEIIDNNDLYFLLLWLRAAGGPDLTDDVIGKNHLNFIKNNRLKLSANINWARYDERIWSISLTVWSSAFSKIENWLRVKLSGEYDQELLEWENWIWLWKLSAEVWPYVNYDNWATNSASKFINPVGDAAFDYEISQIKVGSSISAWAGLWVKYKLFFADNIYASLAWFYNRAATKFAWIRQSNRWLYAWFNVDIKKK